MMNTTSRGRWLSAVLVLLAVAGAISAVSLFAGGEAKAAPPPTDAKIVTKAFTAGPNSTKRAFAKCPGRQRALGGGVLPLGSPANFFVQASGPLTKEGIYGEIDSGDVARQWYAAVNNTSTDPKNLKVFAICGTNPKGEIEESEFTAVGNGVTTEGRVTCPNGRRAVGGGVISDGPPNTLFVRTSGPLAGSSVDADGTKSGDVAKQWYAAVRNEANTPQNLKVMAICARNGQTKAKIAAKEFEVGSTKIKKAKAECPNDNQRVLGGGIVQIGEAPALWLRASGPLSEEGTAGQTRNGDVAKEWSAAVQNLNLTPRTLKVLAICAR